MEEAGLVEDWEVIERMLPEGWQAKAKESGALRRCRGFADAGTLLRVMLIHLVDGCSLRETAATSETDTSPPSRACSAAEALEALPGMVSLDGRGADAALDGAFTRSLLGRAATGAGGRWQRYQRTGCNRLNLAAALLGQSALLAL